MTEVVKCSLEGDPSGGKAMQPISPIEHMQALGGGSDNDKGGMRDDCRLSHERSGKGDYCRSPLQPPPKYSQGWISVQKRRNDYLTLPARGCTGSAPPQGRWSRMTLVNQARNEERLSLNTPDRDDAAEKVQDRCLVSGVMGEGELSTKQSKGSSGESVEGEEHWLPFRVVNCAKAIGMTTDEGRGGWDPLVEYVQNREKQEQADNREKRSKRKGKRELNGLCCSINYDRANIKEKVGKSSNKDGRKKQGEYQVPK